MDRKLIRAFGIIFILIGILAVINSIYRGAIEWVLWYCYIALIINGIGLLKRDSFIIMSQLNIILIPFLFWNVDFFYHLLFGKALWGITDYYFIPRSLVDNFITFQHVFTLPILFYALYKIKIKRKDAWKPSIIYTAVLFVITKIFTSPESNINCVYKSCVPFINGGGLYSLAWFALIFLMIITTNYAITKLFMGKEYYDKH